MTPRQFGDEHTWAFTRSQVHANNPVSGYLHNRVDPSPLNMGAQELAKNRRRGWVEERLARKVEPSCFWIGREQQRECVTRNTDSQCYGVGSRLVDFLNPPPGQDRSNFINHGGGVRCG